MKFQANQRRLVCNDGWVAFCRPQGGPDVVRFYREDIKPEPYVEGLDGFGVVKVYNLPNVTQWVDHLGQEFGSLKEAFRFYGC